MKIVVSILALFFAGFTTMTAQNTPKFQFKTEVIDYGEIKKGSNGVRVFEFKNIGDAPLIIENVYSSCGCTVPSWTKTPVAQGETGQIEVKYNTEIVGPIRRTISITSNADESTKAVKIKGKVLE
ncbi:DUF1573 domain-containing protein [Antarcticibacterium sp. 1MA-6-2]|uniref:DUF1573 domain-containing protein n=1 Tax=Antarcticibacterium sp. 1MA-6-2 TaxID=2908210 RepID=UPI001F470291|nr:DUF1573 domain-containing protein [Antarcticibacterium sp. 1MA-6-2]UJH91114.1 DUF1573 domain-containing protein [Antarcticibacterium sp. 1MA-6-2]